MGGGLVAVGSDPGDLRLKQGNPLSQLVLRIGIERFPRQQAGRIAFGPGQIVIHCQASFGRRRLAVNTPSR